MRKILNQEQSMKKMYEENPGPKKECEKYIYIYIRKVINK